MWLRLPVTRTSVLIAVAVVVGMLLLLDQTGHLPGGNGAAPPSRHEASRVASPVATLPSPSAEVVGTGVGGWQQIATRYAELKGYADAHGVIEAAYAAVAAPYAEAVATYQATYPAGHQPETGLEQLVRQHIPNHLRLVELKISPPQPRAKGGYTSNANITVLGADSQAVSQALLALGNPDNGTLWKELTLTVDAKARSLRLEGLLAITLVESAE